MLSSSHIRILDFSFDGGTANVTKWHYNLLPGLMLGAFCTVLRAGPGRRGLGAQCGWKTAENLPKLKSIFQLPIMTTTKDVSEIVVAKAL